MIGIFSTQIRGLRKELTEIKAKYQAVKDVNEMYSGWHYAFREAIYDMAKSGEVTEEQRSLFFEKAKKYHDIWRTQ